MIDRPRVLLLGATGLFGGLLARRMVREGRFELVAAGRGEAALQALQDEIGVDYRVVDRDDEAAVAGVLRDLNPFVVVDCAGPFQDYGEAPYRFAKQILAAGAHYLDIADASEFVSGIVELDGFAKQKGVSAVSGASSTPAISAAVLDHLTQGLVRVEAIETAIIPGNRARRTYSVMKAVLGQVGQPFEVWRDGKHDHVRGWAETISLDLEVPGKPAVKGRLASLVNTPDIVLFPKRYEAQTVLFRAGLEIKTFHYCLSIGRMLIAAGLLKSLAPFAGFARWFASWFEQIGSDAGGMQVKVSGETGEGKRVLRTWDLIADDGQGPEIPTIPISILLNKLADGNLEAGAKASPGTITLDEVEEQLKRIDADTAIVESLNADAIAAGLVD